MKNTEKKTRKPAAKKTAAVKKENKTIHFRKPLIWLESFSNFPEVLDNMYIIIPKAIAKRKNTTVPI